MSKAIGTLLFLGTLLLTMTGQLQTRGEEPGDGSAQAQQLFDDGNYREALAEYFSVLNNESVATDQGKLAIDRVCICYQQLNEVHKIDEFLVAMAKQHAEHWPLLARVASRYLAIPHYGYQIAGEFRRGNHRGGGKVVNSAERDRATALKLYWQAYRSAREKADAAKVAALLDEMSDAVMHNRDHGQAWRLQQLTDLENLPGIADGWYNSGPIQGAPVDDDGEPVLHELPASWEQANNDGQRWRWLLDEASRLNPKLKNRRVLKRAQFLQSQFGVQTMASYGWWFGRQAEADQPAQTGTFALHTLNEDETIAKLATGIRRFALPDEHNHLKLLVQIVADAEASDDDWRQASSMLASAFENRRQYPRAAQLWRQAIEKNINKPSAQDRLDQIVGNWGRFEATMSQPAGKGAEVDYRFRNGRRVEFVAQRIEVAQLLTDLRAYLKSNPRQLSWEQLQVENLGYRLITQGENKYVGEEVARWSLDLEPRDNHFDRRITVSTPLQDAGAYLLTAKMADGNSTNIVVWLNDTAIVKKPLSKKSLYYVADSVSGQPIPKCNVEFFGYWRHNKPNNKFTVETRNFAELTDENGLVELSADDENRRHQWIAIATNADGRFAFLGFRGIWSGEYYEQQYQQVKVFTITDRPVYRPDQKVQFKFWVRHAQYDLEDESQYAAKSFQIEIRDPRNEKVFTTQLISDAYGGLAGEWQIPTGATLGQYRINVVNHGGGSFRVEEYKKPEFEVVVAAPDEPVQLGEKVSATISAKYYFGSPVTSGTVKYKILRTAHEQTWYPPMPWDWLYGPGYWWFAQEYAWYPGWSRWGCRGPSPWWFWRSPTPPEVIAEREVPLGVDGTIEVEIDTSIAKLLHPDQDHRYQIQAEVVDESRRTIVGNGQVLVAREPYKVFLWLDRGYYRAGDTIGIGTAARTLDGKPVRGTGTLRLLKVQYKDAQPVETEVGSWELPTGENGQARLQIKASEPGQYRLAYELVDDAEHTVEGGQMLTITGDGFNGSQFRFNDLELIPERREYQPGEKVSLQINTNRTGASVLLFARPSNGIYQKPQLVRLDGKSTTVELDVSTKDMPNFFVEAVTVHGGRSHVVTREIFVPPAQRVLNVEVAPSAEAYLPGQSAKLLLKLTDENGEPYVGSLALSIYDKAVEYIAGGSNVADIREFFWKWRRSHRPQGDSNLSRYSQGLTERNKPTMQNLGVFGEQLDMVATLDGSESMRKAGTRIRSKTLAAAPMAAASGVAGNFDDSVPEESSRDQDFESPAEPALVEPTVRENFADTALWKGSLETNSEGITEVELDMPENLTTWKVRVWGMGHGTRVGEGSAEVVTRKNLIVRLQAPRFFVETDEVVLSANVHNYLDEAKQVQVSLELEGDTLVGPDELTQTVEIAADGEQRIDWRVKVAREGTATIRMSALTDEESDAMQMSFPVYVHGMLKTDSFTGVVKPEETVGSFEVTVPAERRPEETRLEVRYTPTLAGAMIDALPYLIEYPYGCTEQTLNRFLPAVMTQQTLRKMGVDLAAIQKQRTNLNAQEIGDDNERRDDWKRFDSNPVFDEAELDKVVKAGVNRLTEMQLSDGGWGWFSGWGERSSAHTTAVVMHGLLIARGNDVAIVPNVIDSGIMWLQNYQSEQIRRIENWAEEDANGLRLEPNKRYADNLDALVYMVLAEAGQDSDAMRKYLYRDRTKLAVYALANFGLALHKNNHSEELAMVMRNLSQYVQQDDENQTAWLNLPGGNWWYWYGSEYEAHAYYLKLLAAIDPKSEVAPRLVKYLLNNRKHATYWNSTRDTALVVEAFADFLNATGEAEPNVTVELWIDGKPRKQVTITRENLFTFDNKLVLEGEALSSGRHTVEIRKQGDSPIYFNGYLTNFTLEDDIRATGLELKVQREYYKLTPIKATTDVAGGRGQVVTQQVEKYRRERLVNLAELESGDLMEVELTVDSKNDYEYILLEDMKAAGFEPVEVRSGYNGNELNAYMELRDDRVSLFVARLARGQHSVAYRLRAEIPGRFSALPTRASAMYAPELKANSDEIKLRVID